MTTDHTDIIEVVTCSKKRVNLFLDRGYRLLTVETVRPGQTKTGVRRQWPGIRKGHFRNQHYERILR